MCVRVELGMGHLVYMMVLPLIVLGMGSAAVALNFKLIPEYFEKAVLIIPSTSFYLI